MDYSAFFEKATGHPPYPYQRALGEQPWPEVLDIPTGLGKTAAAVLAWAFRRYQKPDETPRRLLYCLPMRVLVEQVTEEARTWMENLAPLFAGSSAPTPTVEMLMGGEQEVGWSEDPERPGIVVGTQDMLLSRALMRGYGMSRFTWPIHFAFVHNDAMWVLDETQLMGVGVETSAQLEAFRQRFGTARRSRTLWMSATVGEDQLDTVDHPRPKQGFERATLTDADRDRAEVREKTEACKTLARARSVIPNSESKTNIGAYASDLVDEVVEHHDGDLTLIVCNRVSRAQAIYEELLQREGRDDGNSALIHSRFRPPDRAAKMEMLLSEGDRIVVATQVVEAGVDVSARTMFIELPPWPSFVQRVGRCNRRGEYDDANVFWIDSEEGDKAALPYEEEDLVVARTMLEDLTGEDVGPASLSKAAESYDEPFRIRPVIRQKDLLELFDTTPDLSGNDLDVSRWIRETDDNDVQVYWREWEGDRPPEDLPAPERRELCGVSIGAFNDALGKKSGVLKAWHWDHLDGRWREAKRIIPGQQFLVHRSLGGYDVHVGWTGKKKSGPVPVLAVTSPDENRDISGDEGAAAEQWMLLGKHLVEVGEAATRLCEALDVPTEWRENIVRAAHWHDVGKAHPVFQKRLLEPANGWPEKYSGYTGLEPDEEGEVTDRDPNAPAPPEEPGIWAKSNHRRGRSERRYFRHELASALAWLDTHDGDSDANLVAYLIAAHHGKVRLSIRSLPDENEPTRDGVDDLYARGVWHGDHVPQVDVPGEGTVGPFELDLNLMRMGQGSWLERTIALRDDRQMGPFRLAWLEALVRIADWRASGHNTAPRREETADAEES